MIDVDIKKWIESNVKKDNMNAEHIHDYAKRLSNQTGVKMIEALRLLLAYIPAFIMGDNIVLKKDNPAQ